MLNDEELIETPSGRDGVSAVEEEAARAHAANIVQELGVLLHLPQVTVMRAGVLLQRFWCVASLRSQSLDSAAGAAVMLVSKLDDRSQTPDVIINAMECLRTDSMHATPLPAHSQDFLRQKRRLVRAEQRILRDLGYHVDVEDPYKYLVFYVHEVLQDEPSVLQAAWGYLSDSMLTSACVFCAPHELALASLFLALRKLGRDYPTSVAGTTTPWWALFSVSTERITAVVERIARAYVVVPQPLRRLDKEPGGGGGGASGTQSRTSTPTPDSAGGGLPGRGDTLVLSSQGEGEEGK